MAPPAHKIKDAFALGATISAFAAGFAAALPAISSEKTILILLALAALASLAAACRQLPLQNVLLAAGFTALIGAAAHGLSANPDLAMPFGLLTFNPNAGAKIFNAVPWTVPLIWIIALFNSRGLARLILRPWRKQKNYGYILIGLTAFIMVGFDLALEPFAVHGKHLWLWHPTKFPWTWHGATPLNFLGWFCIALLILVFATPSLIKKQPGNSGAAELFSPVIWFGCVLLFATGAGHAGLWSAVVLDGILAALLAGFCWRGAKW
jgi:uncharacterized membrane protein